MEALAGERRITYDARGLAEPFADVPKISEIDGDRAVFDAKDLTARQINLELRWLLYEQGLKDVTVLNPGAKHSLGVGILTRCRITFDGSLRYFRSGAPRRRPRRQGPRRRPYRDRPEGRHDHRARLGRLDDGLHDAARPPDPPRRRRLPPRRLHVRRHDLRRRQGQ